VNSFPPLSIYRLLDGYSQYQIALNIVHRITSLRQLKNLHILLVISGEN